MKPKGQSLDGDNLQAVLDSGRNAARVGRQQFFTPHDVAAALTLPLPKFRETAVDLHMGAGALLSGCQPKTALGADIDSRLARKPAGVDASAWHCINADTTLLYPILTEIDWRADLFVLNPPFSVQWRPERLADLAESGARGVREAFDATAKQIDSTLATYLMALDRMTRRGEGYMLCNEATAIRLFGNPGEYIDPEDHDLRSHIWLWLTIPPGMFPECQPFNVAVLYFAREHYGPLVHLTAPDASALSIRNTLAPSASFRHMTRTGLSVLSVYEADAQTIPLWQAAKEEYAMRHAEKRRPWNLWLNPDGTIGRHLTPFQQNSERIPRGRAIALNELQGKTPMDLVVQKPSRTALTHAVHGTLWNVEPALIAAVDGAIANYNAVRAPLYPLNPMQRLGYLDEEDTIACAAAGIPGFTVGARYPLASQTVNVERKTSRINFIGNEEDLTISGHELCFTITDEAGKAHSFMNPPKPDDPLSHPLESLVANFAIPEVPDVAAVQRAAYEANMAKLAALETRLNAA